MTIDPARRRTAHLLRRAGFGATAAELDDWSRLSHDDAVDRLISVVDDSALAERAFAQGYDLTTMDGYRAVWLYRMRHTGQPLQEKMALFWHGHFATSSAKVNRPGFVFDQYRLFGRQGLGAFGDLARAVARDPAMMLFLDLQQSRVGKPNENFARELMELFTTGIGPYTEQDVAEAARAFTGWTVLDGVATFVPRRHDPRPKTVLGITGRLVGDDVISILLDRPETATFLARKLVRFFVTDAPDEAFVTQLAATLRASGYDLATALAALLRSPEFLAETSFHALIKSPVELLIGTLKAFDIAQVLPEHARLLRAMGQDLFAPPTVKGWDGGLAWLSTSTLLQRLMLASAVVGGRAGRGLDVPALADDLRQRGLTDPAAIVDAWLTWLVDGDATPAARATLTAYLTAGLPGSFALAGRQASVKLRGLLHLLLSSPVYHLN
ncbi:MAG: DUF1800 domain-containing protein [Chloroflexi bacterium]|nr:DUF1800 domain-containing protein [Chloroflexota bacterium]